MDRVLILSLSLALLAAGCGKMDARRLISNHSKTRAAAIKDAGKWSPERRRRAVEALRLKLKSDHQRTARRAANALGTLGRDAEAAVDDLVEQFENRRVVMLRSSIATALAKNSDGKRAAPKLLRVLMRERDYRYRHKLISGWGFRRLAKHNTQLFEALKECAHSDDKPSFRGVCFELMGTLHEDVLPKSVQELGEALQSDHKEIRAGALRGLNWAGGAAGPTIPKMLEAVKKRPEDSASLIVLLEHLKAGDRVTAEARTKAHAGAKTRAEKERLAALEKKRAKDKPRYEFRDGKKRLVAPYRQKLASLPEAIRSSDDAKWRAGAWNEMIRQRGRARFLIPFAAEMLDRKKHPDWPSFKTFLSAAGPPEGKDLPPLSEMLKNPSEQVRKNASLALRAMGDRARPAYGVLFRAAEKAESGERMAHATTLLKVHPKESASILLRFMREEKAEGGKLLYARMALDAGAGEEAERFLVERVKQGKPKAIQEITRSRAAGAAVPILVANLGSGKGSELTHIYALAKVGSKAGGSVPLLMEKLGSETPAVRSAAAYALGRIGPKAKPAAKKLKALKKDPSASVRRHADAALKAVGEDKPWWKFW